MQNPIAALPQKFGHAVADTWRRWRAHRASVAELAGQDPAELGRMASDVNLSCDELINLVRRDAGSADLVDRRLRALGFDPAALSAKETAVMRDLQRCCSGCNSKRRCANDLDAGITRGSWREYCPNALTLAALIAQRRRSPSFAARTMLRQK
jgi:hypothetical protein